jgi:hypothetical protein
VYDPSFYCSVEALNQQIRAAEEHIKQLKKKQSRRDPVARGVAVLSVILAALAIDFFMTPTIMLLPTPVGWVMLGLTIFLLLPRLLRLWCA